MIAEGVHYLPGTDPFYIAWKLVAVNLSDLAAKGAEPLGVLIGASLTDGSERFVEGLRAILTEYDVPLIGGDTIRPIGPAAFGCTAIGRATTRPVPCRSGARPGNRLYVAGELGAARYGHAQCVAGGGVLVEGFVEAYLKPRPLLAEGRILARDASAMMDISDGLLLDATRMADASGVTIALYSAAIPLSRPYFEQKRREGRGPFEPLAGGWREAASWGDDYALLVATDYMLEQSSEVATSFVGDVLPRGEHAVLVDGQPVTGSLGYEHR
jgi:thiamine-monophosphate kinase